MFFTQMCHNRHNIYKEFSSLSRTIEAFISQVSSIIVQVQYAL